jgi:hypothetical protein
MSANMLGMYRRILPIVLSLLAWSGTLSLCAQGTTFNYQGRLNVAGAPANGSYDLKFAIYNAVTNGNLASVWLTNNAVGVSNGLFNTTLNFGSGIFTGTNYWLDIAVRATGETNFTTLWPRQPVLPVPYAIFANTASNLLGTVSAAQLSGTVPSSQISGTYANPVNFTNAGNTFSGTFSGNGSNLTSLSASQLTGTVADARLTPNVALLNANQTFTGANTFTNTGNRFTGSFFGNGNVGWDAFSGPTVQAEFNHGYLLTNSQFATVILPPTPSSSDSTNIGYIVRISGAGGGGWQTAQATNQFIIGNFAGYRNSDWVPTYSIGTWNCLASSLDGKIMYAAQSGTVGIYGSSDSGHIWSPVGNNPGQNWTGLACSADGSKIYAAPKGSSVIFNYSTNFGADWLGATVTGDWVGAASSASGSNVLTSINSGNLVFFTNAPASWSYRIATGTGVANNNWSAVAISPDGTKLAASIMGKSIFVSTNFGASWFSNAPYASWTDVVISADGTRLAATALNNTIYISVNSGATWSKAGSPTNNWSCLSASADCSRIVAGASNGVLYASVNFGLTWAALKSPTNQAWSAITSSADGSQLAAAVNNSLSGRIYYSGASDQITTQTSTNGVITGSQRSSVELQYIGNGQFMPVSSAGTLWAN